jgi:HEAT repeat protein
MPPSETDLSEICESLVSADRADRPDIAPRLQEWLFGDAWRFYEIRQPDVERVAPLLESPDPTVRSSVLTLVGIATAIGLGESDGIDVDRPSPERIESVLSALDDEAAVVRQVASSRMILDNISSVVLDGETEIPPEQISRRVFESFRDPEPVVRTRVSKILDRHAERLVAAHPDPESAVDTLVAGLSDPAEVYALGVTKPGKTPRVVAARVLRREGDRLPVATTVEDSPAIDDLLNDSHERARREVTRLVRTLYEEPTESS